MERTTARYGSWRSSITAGMAAAAGATPVRVQIDGEVIYYLERRPNERGRNVIVRCDPGGTRSDMTPSGFDVRTRVHEYGGGAFIVAGGVIHFANSADQRVYRQAPGGLPEPLTPDGIGMRYADFCHDPQRGRLICVREDHSGDGEAVNTLVALDLTRPGAGEILASGYDFYSTPRLDPEGQRLAWLSWRHPNMPWDGCELWLADVGADGTLTNQRLVAGGASESIVQPEWSGDAVLYFASDRTGFWNLFRLTSAGPAAICPMAAEFAQPQWSFDQPLFGFLDDTTILSAYIESGTGRLATLDTQSLRLNALDFPYSDIREVRASRKFGALIAGSPLQQWTVVRLDISPDRAVTTRNLRESSELPVDEDYISVPEKIEFPTERGLKAFAYFFRPQNPQFSAPRDELPPLLVFSHGGPTGAASAVLSLGRQFWTSRGFAVLDVDYGGSTGYGRAYRERLNGNWGVVDVEDCVNGARYLAKKGEVDPDRLIIRGGSAGGYTVLCALTFFDVFKAGASHYGIGDLEALEKDTHKFESRYNHGLVAPYPEGRDVYMARSPIHFTERLSCPLILFQGLADPVVPPAQSQMMFEAVRKKGLPVAYVAFEGEEHGFRQAKNVIRAMEAELYFYGRVFGFEPADEIEPVQIDNLP